MKKIVFLIFIIAIGGLAYMGEQNIHFQNRANVLRVAFPSSGRPLDYEPTSIRLAYEYLFLENIYSPIVEIDPKDGSIKAGIADSMEWRGNDLHLRIRENLRTASGKLITAEDVVFSLKRLLFLTGNTHGNFGDLVCPGVTLTSVEEDCPGIHLVHNTVILKAEKRKSFLLPMLGAIDFAVIPKDSVDPKTLKIINYKETSGPYYVSEHFHDGSSKLLANPYHYNYKKEMPQVISMISFDRFTPKGGLQLLEEGKVDHVMTVNAAPIEDLLEYAKRNDDTVNVHVTMNIRNTALTFTDVGLKELSKAEREEIAKAVKESFQRVYKDKIGYSPSHEFFAPTADGGLGKLQETINQKYRGQAPSVHKEFRLALLRSGNRTLWEDAVKIAIPNAKYGKDVRIPDLTVYEHENEKPHAFIATTDSSYFEDINLISYSLNAGYFGLSKEEKKKWLAQYMAIENKDERLKFLRDLHFKVLDEMTLVPLVISPFVALSTKEWKMELSQLFANNQLWLLKRQ